MSNNTLSRSLLVSFVSLFASLAVGCGGDAQASSDAQSQSAALTGSGLVCQADADCLAGEECDDNI